MKTNSKNRAEFPKRLKLCSAEVTIYRHTNRTRRLNSLTGQWEPSGKVFADYVLAY